MVALKRYVSRSALFVFLVGRRRPSVMVVGMVRSGSGGSENQRLREGDTPRRDNND